MSQESPAAAGPPAYSGDIDSETSVTYDYDAFLSYSRRDAAIADGIQKGLHRIGRRAGRLHALRVFRDKTDLAASPSLWGKITEALDRSRYLTVVLSPSAAASEWVNKELAYWLEHRGADHLLIVLADGALEFDEAAGRFDPDLSDAAPPLLTEQGVLASEPIYVDVSADAPWDAHTPVFRDKVTDLAAPIHGKSKYELASDDVREQRRFRRLRRAAVFGLVLLTVLAVAAATVAVVQQRAAVEQRREALRQRAEAIHQRNQAVALQMTSESESILAGSRGGGDFRALAEVLAAHAIAPAASDGGLLNAVAARSDTVKIIPAATDDVLCVAFSPDGRRVISGSRDKSARIWDVETGRQIGPPLLHTDFVNSVAWSPDGRRVASGGSDRTLRIWDAQTGQPIGQPLKYPGGVDGVGFSPDGRRVVAASYDGTLRVWDVESGRQVGEVSTGGHDGLRTAALSPDGKRVLAVMVGDKDTVRVWDVETGREVGTPFPVYDVAAFSPDGQRVVSGGLDHTVQIWDVETGQQITALTGHTDAVTDVAWSPDGRRVVSSSGDNTVRIWDPDTRQEIGAPLTGHGVWVNSVAWSADSRRIVSGGADGSVRVWDVDAGREADVALQGHTGDVNSVAFSRDGRRIVSGGNDRTVQTSDAETGQRVAMTSTASNGGSVFALSSDGRRAATGNVNGGEPVRIWDVETGRPISTLRIDPEDFRPWGGAFSPDDGRFVTGDDGGTVLVWDANTGDQIGAPLKGHHSTVFGVAFSPDGRRVVSGGYDKTVRIWDVETGRELGAPLTGHTSAVKTVAFSADGRRVVSGSGDGTVRAWDVATGLELGGPYLGHTDTVYSVTFSRDGRHVVSGSADKTVRMWDVETGQQIGPPLTGHQGTVRSVAISADERHIVSGGSDNSVRVWPGPAEWPELLCRKLAANMTHQQWRDWVSLDIDYVAQCPGLPIPD
ncbi:MAG TPA: TIR domain-containing protein [Mycobacterium sp.]|nr:TIR domain-containing protein [Mycobacterium sp.]